MSDSESSAGIILDQHLRDCGLCRAVVEEQWELDHAIRDAVLSEAVETTSILGKIQASMHESTREHKRIPTRLSFLLGWRPVLPVAAFLLALIVFMTLSNVRLNSVYASAGSDHIDDVVRALPKSGWQTTPAMIEAYLDSRLLIKDAAKQLQLPGYRISMVRDCHLANVTYIHIVYTDGKEEVSLYLRRRSASLTDLICSSLWMPGIHSRPEDGLSVTRGRNQDYIIFLVGNLNASASRTLVAHTITALSPKNADRSFI